VDRGDGPGVAGQRHEPRHAAGLIGEGAPGIVVGVEGFGDLGNEADSGAADPPGDRGVDWSVDWSGHRQPEPAGAGIGRGAGRWDGGGSGDGCGPLADPVEPGADDLPYLVGGCGDD